MQIATKWATAWLIAVSVMALAVTVWDKRRARRQAWRVPERTLWLVAALGGTAVMYLTMHVVRHKTRHRRFMWGLPALLVAQGALLLWLLQENILNFV